MRDHELTETRRVEDDSPDEFAITYRGCGEDFTRWCSREYLDEPFEPSRHFGGCDLGETARRRERYREERKLLVEALERLDRDFVFASLLGDRSWGTNEGMSMPDLEVDADADVDVIGALRSLLERGSVLQFVRYGYLVYRAASREMSGRIQNPDGDAA